MRAAEVQFDAVRAGVFHVFDDLLPFLPGFHHERSDHGVIWKILFDLFDFAQVSGQRPVGNQLDIGKARHPGVAVIQPAVAARYVDDRYAQRFPDGPAPARLEGFHDLVPGIGGWRGGQPEGVGRLYSCEIDGEIRHGFRIFKFFNVECPTRNVQF